MHLLAELANQHHPKSRGYGYQWKDRQITSRPGNQVLRQGWELFFHLSVLHAAMAFTQAFICPLQVLLPLIDQTFKNHCLYFLSTPSKNLSSCGCASNKEKEMITRYCGGAIITVMLSSAFYLLVLFNQCVSIHL